MSEIPQKHGVFYPRGYVIATFESPDRAQQVRQRLLDGGYDEEDVQVLDTERVLTGTTQDLEQLSPLIKALGSEGDVVHSHQRGAEAGHGFLLAYAPSDLETRRLMNVVRRAGFVNAVKYDRFTMTRL